MKFDCELTAKDVQDLASADAVAAFFAKLGYNTDARTQQTLANLGITAEGAARPINRIELLADQEGLLQIYLFEVKSVTVTHIRALARTFRNRAGNYLLVLTSDYEHLDFVLIDKELPTAAGPTKGIAQKQVVVRPRMLTVERRKPDRVHLRVLRRFTYTEADPVAQYDKLRSAYGIAEWSEDLFNNRALFSDYYLLERLRDRGEWAEDPKPAYLALRELHQDAASTFRNQPEKELRAKLLEPTLEALGFSFKAGKKAKGEAAEPDYRLLSPENPDGTLAVCLAYPWGRSLDGKDDRRDNETPDENPNFVVVSLLERKEASWAIVTNGKTWRLYSARAHAKATNYYEVDLEEVLAAAGPHAGGPADAFRYFWLLFRRQAFEPQTVAREGKEQTRSFLDQLLTESEDYAKELGERLKERVFVAIFPHVAEGFIASIRQQEGKDADLPQERLDQIFQGTLTLLYRLLFLLYAESRDLLPVRETRGYFEISLAKLKAEIAEAAGTIADEVGGKLERHYRDDAYDLYHRLMRLFGAVDQGDASVNVPFYNGGLFITKPGDDDQTPEAANARFLNAHKVPDRFLARAIDLMARDPDPKRQDLVFVDFKSLGVRHLGSIYEGLLEFKVRIADKKLGVKKEKGREVYVPFSEMTDREKARAEREGKVVRKGHCYLENDKQERKATGSYYTPDHIVEYIVEHTVGPVLEEKFEKVRPLLRKAQEERRRWLKAQDEMRKLGRPDAQGDRIGRQEVVRQLFDVKVLDPAMGSGHFLVEAVDFITDRMLDFLNAFPWNPVRAFLEETREAILEDVERQGVSIDRAKLTDVNLLKRYVLKRCIYGVDLNPMAVELAKVSLWLDCFTLGAPLSFLDHHIRCGNSLIGVTVDEVREGIETGEGLLWGTRFAGLMLATDLMRHVGELSDATSAQVQESRREYRQASDALAPFKRILDVYTSRWFGNEPQKKGKKAASGFDPAMEFLRSPEIEGWLSDPKSRKGLTDWDKKVVERTLASVQEKRFFHWELEFPEVFYSPSEGSAQKIERLAGAGFDAVVGNPPYDVLSEKETGEDLSQLQAFLHARPVYAPSVKGKNNFFKLFICRGLDLPRKGGMLGFIVPMALLGDDTSSDLRRSVFAHGAFRCIEAFPQKDDAKQRVFFEAKLSTVVFTLVHTHDKKVKCRPLISRVHQGRFVLADSPTLRLTAEEIPLYDPSNLTIVSCAQDDWDLAVRITRSGRAARLGEYAEFFQGEVNETVQRSAGNLVDKGGRLVVRGAGVCLYVTRPASQGTDLFLNVTRFLAGARSDSKAFHHEQRRVVLQATSPQNNFRRIIAALLPEDEFCNHQINYCPEQHCALDLRLLVALLNSKLVDWYFRLGSTNAYIGHYQLCNLPCPLFRKELDKRDQEILAQALESLKRGQYAYVAETLDLGSSKPPFSPAAREVIVETAERITSIEKARGEIARAERSALDPEAQPYQDLIDRLFYAMAGLTEDESKGLEERLARML